MYIRRTIILCLLSTAVGAGMTYLIGMDRQRCRGNAGLFGSASDVSMAFLENVGPYDVFREVCMVKGRRERRLVLVNCQSDLLVELPEDASSRTISVGRGAMLEWYRQWSNNGERLLTRAVAVKADGDPGERIWDLDGAIVKCR